MSRFAYFVAFNLSDKHFECDMQPQYDYNTLICQFMDRYTQGIHHDD